MIENKLANFGSIEITEFAKRQWNANFAGTKMKSVDQKKLISIMNNCIENMISRSITEFGAEDAKIHYMWHPHPHPEWDFCKYLIFKMPDNDICTGTVRMSLDIVPFIRTGYVKRTPDELPYLSRWVELPHGFKSDKATYICAVLYSKEQLMKEHNADANSKVPFTMESDYGVVAFLGQPTVEIPPPSPATILRNSMGKEFGGNGTTLNVEEYKKSVEYWEANLLCK